MEPQLELLATTLALLAFLFAKRLTPAILAIIGVISWFNFDPVRSIGTIHYHDTFHYYIGSKYFNELEYAKLYQCAIQASQEQSSFLNQTEHFSYRKLSDNSYSTVTSSETSLFACDKTFSNQRWQEFKADILWFQDKLGPSNWRSMFNDHGFNASPFWIAWASVVNNYFPPNDGFFFSCRIFEFTLLLLSFLYLAKAFGYLAAGTSMAIFGLGYLNDYSWTGAAFFRHDWLILTLLSLSLLKLNRIGSAVFLATVASALRVFPVIALALVITKTAMGASKEARQKSLGVLILTTLLIIIVTLSSTPQNSAQIFFENSKKHQSTRSRNSISLIDTVDNISNCKYGTRSIDNNDCDMENIRTTSSTSLIVKILGICLAIASLIWIRSLELVFIAGFLILPWLVPLSSYYYAFLCLIGAFSDRNKPLVLGVLTSNWILWFMAVGSIETSKIYLFAGALTSMLGFLYISSEIRSSKRQLKT